VINSVSAPDRFKFLEDYSPSVATFTPDPMGLICVSGQCATESHSGLCMRAAIADQLVLRGHKSGIRRVAISDDARIAVMGDKVGKQIWLWDLRERDLVCPSLRSSSAGRRETRGTSM
jgi:hypothetical protein